MDPEQGNSKTSKVTRDCHGMMEHPVAELMSVGQVQGEFEFHQSLREL